jgi:nicotinamidase-related amidase
VARIQVRPEPRTTNPGPQPNPSPSGAPVIEIEGKAVFTELAELVDPGHAALVLVDMQRDFLDPDGAFGRLGVDLGMYPAMRPRLAALLAAGREAELPVFHIQMSTLPGRTSDSPAQLRFNLRMHASARAGGPPLRYTEIGTPGREFAEEFQPLPGEVVVPKWRSSAFHGTNLDLLLRSNGIKTVVVTGCTTEGCVESTARDALFGDYYVVVVEDCVASDDRRQHEASLLLMRHRFDVAASAEIVKLWRARASGEPAVARESTSR